MGLQIRRNQLSPLNLTIAWIRESLKTHYATVFAGVALAMAALGGAGVLDGSSPASRNVTSAVPRTAGGSSILGTNLVPSPVTADAARATAPITYYLVDSEEAAQIWAAQINAEVSDNDGKSYFLAPGMAGFDDALETLDKSALNVSVMDLRGR